MAENPLVDAVDDATDEDRVTLGQRIAGLKQPSYMPVTTPSGADVAAPDVRPPVTFDPNSLPEAIRPKQLTPEEVPSAPIGGNNPNLAALAKQQATLSTPINPYDSATGKIKPQYRMGLGQRILGTAGNFLTGFGGDRSAPVNVGPGAVGWRYGREERARQGALEGVNTQIGTQEKLDTENEKLMRDAMRQAYEGQVGAARGETAAAQRENADTRKQLEASQAALNQARANKADQDPTSERAANADKYGLKGQARTDYILTGKLPKDMLGAGRQPSELETWMAAFKRDNGREPTADEIANRKSRNTSKADQIEKDKGDRLQKAEAKAAERIDKLRMFKGQPDDQINPAAKQRVYDDLEKEKALIQQEYEARVQENTRQTGGRRGAPTQPAPSTNKPAPTKIDPNNLPKQVIVNGKTRNVAGYNKQTGKVILAPEGQ